MAKYLNVSRVRRTGDPDGAWPVTHVLAQFAITRHHTTCPRKQTLARLQKVRPSVHDFARQLDGLPLPAAAVDWALVRGLIYRSRSRFGFAFGSHGNDATTSRETSPGQACQVTTKTITSPIFITLRGHVVHVSYDFKLNNTINKYNDKLPKLVPGCIPILVSNQ